jgi:wobble nucleotide-excising tRNase
MIESIQIAGIATYGSTPEVLSGLSKFNFFFGSNGSGKTTITRVVADELRFPTCPVIWKGGNKLEPMVYNSDFVAKNFNQPTELKGIFTLGEGNVNAFSKIALAQIEVAEQTRKIGKLTLDLEGADGAGGKKNELLILDEAFKAKCWAQKQKHDATLAGAFEGFRNNAGRFKDKLLQEFDSNSATLESLADLERRAGIVFGPTPAVETSIPVFEVVDVLAHEAHPILKKRVIGKEDVDIAAVIQRLGNSDWVKEGRIFYDANGDVCPFCQQITSQAFAKSLDSYFDETFERDSKAIDKLGVGYRRQILLKRRNLLTNRSPKDSNTSARRS